MNLLLLLASLLALLAGPLLWVIARGRASLLAALDGFVLFAITALVLFEVLPESLQSGGAWSLAFVVAGALGPTLLESLMEQARRDAHVATLALALLGLVLHSIGDGTALASDGPAHGALGLAVAIHTVPVGLAVWWLLYPSFGALLPSVTLLAMAAATIAGFHLETDLAQIAGTRGWSWFQALVAGSILHVVFGRPHLHHEGASVHAVHGFYEGLGNLAAVAVLAMVELLHVGGGESSPGFLEGFAQRLLALALLTAPMLLLAHLIAGGFKPQLSAVTARWLAHGGSLLQALKGSLLGLSRCSADASPTYISLRQRGVPTAAATAYLVAACALGETALLVSLPLLGAEMTALRLAAVAVLAPSVALIVSRLTRPPPVTGTPAPDSNEPKFRPATALAGMLRSGTVGRVDQSAPWIVAGLALAALAAPLVYGQPWAQFPDVPEVLLLALLGLPFYSCPAAATPLAAVFLGAGVSPGAALCFLLVGPAGNIALSGLATKTPERIARIALGAAAIAGALLIGWLVNLAGLHPEPGYRFEPLASGSASLTMDPLNLACLTVLLVLVAGSLLRRGGRAFFGELFHAVR